MTEPDRGPAVLHLRKGEERRVLAGHPWIYSNEIDTARSPLRQFEPGEAVEVLGSRGQWVARAYVNPHSLIAGRVTSLERGRPLDRREITRRLSSAARWRERLYDRPFYRWIHGEADDLPGLVVDRFGDVAVAQINTAGMERLRDDIVAALVETGEIGGVLLRCDGDQRALEGLSSYTETAHGRVPDMVELFENGIRFEAPLADGQKTGWFYDQAENRRRFAPLLSRGTVIDAFCYAGAWGVTAALAGAERVICIDSSERALELARRNAALNGVAGRMGFLRDDAGVALDGLASGPPADAVVVDPPAFVKRKKDLGAGLAAYQRLNERALAVMGDEGFLVSCSCSQHVDRDAFLKRVQRAGRRGGRSLRLLFEGGQAPDHPVHPAMPESRYLKALALRVDGT